MSARPMVKIIFQRYPEPIPIAASVMSTTPNKVMTKALAAGIYCCHAVKRGALWTTAPPFTKRSPTTVNTAASPKLKATTNAIPKVARFTDTAARSRTSAEGQGRSPPETPSKNSERQVTGEPSAPGGKWEWP
jgi:hypothetical protein